MSFVSLSFVLFFPVVTAAYFLLPHRFRWWLLLAASAVFYMAFIPAFALVLAGTIGIDYAMGRLIASSEGPRRKAWLGVSLVANLAVLATFKYANFLNDNVRAIAGWLHWHYPIEHLAILLPIGLSFHIFQSLSYVIEVYRGRQAPERHLGHYALYVMFYPQLVAGPIERPQHLLAQLRERHDFDAERVASGLKRMTWGFFKKLVIADRLATFVTPVYAHPTDYTGLPLLFATVLFAFQIYCDFSGYVDIALGASEVMGIRLMENFRRPYAAASIAEFWGRWHISLSSWFRDYLYIPLGGNRVPFWRWNLNLIIVFLVSGLWHGANWTFLAWGALHAGYLVMGNVARRLGLAVAPDGPWRRALGVATTFALVCFAWIFFRAASLTDAWYITTHLFVGLGDQLARGPAEALAPLEVSGAELAWIAGLIALLEGVQLIQAHWGARRLLARAPGWVRLSVYNLALWSIALLGVQGNSAFIYFQF